MEYNIKYINLEEGTVYTIPYLFTILCYFYLRNWLLLFDKVISWSLRCVRNMLKTKCPQRYRFCLDLTSSCLRIEKYIGEEHNFQKMLNLDLHAHRLCLHNDNISSGRWEWQNCRRHCFNARMRSARGSAQLKHWL